jgi:hypothetical protein
MLTERLTNSLNDPVKKGQLDNCCGCFIWCVFTPIIIIVICAISMSIKYHHECYDHSNYVEKLNICVFDSGFSPNDDEIEKLKNFIIVESYLMPNDHTLEIVLLIFSTLFLGMSLTILFNRCFRRTFWENFKN